MGQPFDYPGDECRCDLLSTRRERLKLSRETALGVRPKIELEVVAKQEEAKGDRLDKMARRIGLGSLSGLVVCGVGAFAIPLAPVVAPILGLAGVVSLFGGVPVAVVLYNKAAKARKRQKEALGTLEDERVAADCQRVHRLWKAATTALQGAIADGTIRQGLDLRIEPQGETPKKVHVETVDAAVAADGEKRLKISARLFEADGRNIDWLKEYSPEVSWEQTVAAFPDSAIEPLRAALGKAQKALADAASPAAREPEKRLPPCTPV